MAQTVGLPTDQVRRRLLAVLFSGSGLTRIGFIAGITVATLVAEEMLGSATFVGLPVAGATIGIALGTTPIAALMSRYGRRPGLAAGMLVAAGGGVVAAFAAQLGLFPLLVAGMVLMGFGTAADRLARYAAAEVSPPERRSYAIGLVVWAGTIGSVVGPVLLEPVESLAEALGLEGLVGPYLLMTVTALVAAALAFTLLRPDPLFFVAPLPADHDGPIPLRELFGVTKIRLAVVALVTGQAVMVLIMTMTPVHIRGGR